MDRLGLIEKLAEAMHPALFTKKDYRVGPATQMARDDARKDAQQVLDSGLVIPRHEYEREREQLEGVAAAACDERDTARTRVKELEEIVENLETENRSANAEIRSLSMSMPRRFPGS